MTRMPSLTRRVAAGLARAHDRWGASAEWYVVADDDTFLRVGPLRAYLSLLNPAVPRIVGRRVPKPELLTPWSKGLWGEFQHCAGNGWAISRAAMTALRPALEECLATPHIVLRWYYDEIQLGRCLHVLLGIECEEPRSPAHTRPETTIFLDRSEKDATAVAPTAIKFHPVLAEEQHALRKAFEHVDAQWVQIFLRAAKAQGYGETRPPRAGEL